jgi:hypothetical protein
LGHLVSTGHSGASGLDARAPANPAYAPPPAAGQKSWFARLFAQFFHRRQA